MNITSVGVDLAKRLITVYATNAQGQRVLLRNFKPAEFAAWLAQLPKGTLVAMEACSMAHHWARRLRELGLEPRLIAPHLVTPFRKSQAAKNDKNDAEAIWTAMRQPNMRFVAVKSVDQQARLTWHRVRQGWNEERTALISRARGLLAEFGFTPSQGSAAFTHVLPELLEDPMLPDLIRPLLAQMREHLTDLDDKIAACSKAIAEHAKHDARAQRLRAVAGVGPMTADATSATVPNPGDYKNGRQFAASLGLTPKQFSSGGKTRLGRITRRGDAYLRTLLVQGARSALKCAQKRADENRTQRQRWMVALAERIGYQKTLIAIANKHARVLWALMAKGETYDPNHNAFANILATTE